MGRPDSVIVSYPNFVVNNDAKSLKRLRRFSEKINLAMNEVIERQRQGFWRDVDVDGGGDDDTDIKEQTEDDRYSLFIEQQGYYDLDGDGYEEPYTFVVHCDTKTVMRIIPRFELDQVFIKGKIGDQGVLSEYYGDPLEGHEVTRIDALENITKYGFIRDPQGGLLDVGFYYLLGALTQFVNATTNQLIDAGTLSNLSSSTGWLAPGS